MSSHRLQPLYYLHNFRLALAALKERYAGLLNASEAEFIGRFAELGEPAQCLLTRLVMRKGPYFRRATLHYAEVPDLDSAVQELAALRWLDPDPRVPAAQLARVLSAAELRLAVGLQRCPRSHVPGVGRPPPQLALPLADPPPLQRSLTEWSAHLAGCVVHLRAESVTTRLQLLFFGNHHQSWAQFVLADLGVKRYEAVALDATARAFRTRDWRPANR